MRPVVLHLIDSFREGGSERQAVQLAKLLDQSGRYTVRVACLNRTGPLRAEFGDAFGEIRCYPLTSFYDHNAFRQLCRFVRYLRSETVDIVHSHDFYTNIFGMAAAAIARVSVRIASRRESSKRHTLKRWIERRAYGSAHRIVVNCDHVRRQLIRESVNPSKLVTVYNGLSLGRVDCDASPREEILRRLNLPQDGSLQFVSMTANLREVKDHKTFLRAASRVLSAKTNVVFVLAGEGPLRQPLLRFADDLGIARNTVFLGRSDRVADLLRISDVCVLTSLSEGFSNSILEYMAARRPVVATDVGGVREALEDGDAGYIVPPGDDEAVAAHIVSLLNDRKRAREMGARGRAVVEQNFSCEILLRRVEQLYDSLLDVEDLEESSEEQMTGEVSCGEIGLR